jgi:hypothetical protein
LISSTAIPLPPHPAGHHLLIRFGLDRFYTRADISADPISSRLVGVVEGNCLRECDNFKLTHSVVRRRNAVLAPLITSIDSPDTRASFASCRQVLNESAAVWLQLDLRVVCREAVVVSLDLHLAANPDSLISCVAEDEILADGLVVDEGELFRISDLAAVIWGRSRELFLDQEKREFGRRASLLLRKQSGILRKESDNTNLVTEADIAKL